MEFESSRREEEPTSVVGVAIRGWKPSTTAGYLSHLRRLADIEDEIEEEGNLPEVLSRKLACHVQHGGSASAARGIISAVRACEDLHLVSGVVQPIHWRLAKAGAQAGVQEYASPVLLRHLVEKAVSNDERLVGVMALVSYVCFLRVAEAASVLVGDVRDSGYVVFWNSKTGDEGWQRRPVPKWLRPFVEWIYEWAVERGCERDDLLFPAGAAFLEKTLIDIVYGTTWAGHRWHCFRRGGAAACWKRGPSLPHFKWWGRWAATATAMAYALGYRDEDVVSPLCLPQVWDMAPRAMFVDPEGVWGDIMFDDRSQQKNKPVWGRGERRRAAPSMARGKRFAGEPRSDAADLGSSSDESDSGVSADEEVGPRPGLRQDARVVLQVGTRRSERSGSSVGRGGDGGRPGSDPGPSVPAGSGERHAGGAGRQERRSSTSCGLEFKFTAPPSGRSTAEPTAGPWRSANAAGRGGRGVKRSVGGRALSVPPRRQGRPQVALAQSSERGSATGGVARTERRGRQSDGESGPRRKRSRTVPSNSDRRGG